jgi:hypothetical protein
LALGLKIDVKTESKNLELNSYNQLFENFEKFSDSQYTDFLNFQDLESPSKASKDKSKPFWA